MTLGVMGQGGETVERIPGYCALCISRCGSIAVVENGRFLALEPDPSHDPFGPEGANPNLIIGNAAIDPISGSVPHRAYLCQISRGS